MTMSTTTLTSAEAQIRDLVEQRVRAIRARDPEPLVEAVSGDITLYDALDSLQRRGKDDVRAKTEQWLGWYGSEIGFEVRDPRVEAGDTAGWCHFLYRVTGTMKNGSPVDMWVRSTLCLRKEGERWLIAHEHASVPFDAESGKALVTLQP
jgi:uncharacterized protein (TIGR02246 family)